MNDIKDMLSSPQWQFVSDPTKIVVEVPDTKEVAIKNLLQREKILKIDLNNISIQMEEIDYERKEIEKIKIKLGYKPVEEKDK